MPTTGCRGLAGRARRVRNRNRAERLSAQQLIREHMEPELEQWEPDRYIPIGGRNDFLPAIAIALPDEQPRRDTQLELPLATRNVSDRSHHGIRGESRETSAQRAVRDRAALRGRPREVFSLGRFLYGCLLGSSAAAMILLALHVVL